MLCIFYDFIETLNDVNFETIERNKIFSAVFLLMTSENVQNNYN
jgi:hypothetical protein